MIQDHAGDERSEERTLQTRPDPQSMPAPLAAMAEALRANAEALKRLDSSQRRIAETIERSDRSQQVVTSTRALNETFRGLSEIQRGLLDTLVRTRSRGGGGSPLLLLAVALLAGLLSVLLYDKWLSDRVVPVQRFEEARADLEKLHDEADGLRADLRQAGDRDRARDSEAAAQAASLKEAERLRADQDEKLEQLRRELETKNARLEQFLAVKAQADLSGALQVRNTALEQEVRELQGRIRELEEERRNTLSTFGEKLMDLRGVDPETIRDIARKMDLYKDPEAPPRPGGPAILTRTGKRLLLSQVNLLLPDGEEAYELLDAASLADGCTLRDVTLARHRNNRLVSTLVCKEMVILVDPGRDTVELRLTDGYLTNTGRPDEKIPIPAEGHSLFLTGAGLKDWLRRFSDQVTVGEGGRLTWKSTPS